MVHPPGGIRLPLSMVTVPALAVAVTVLPTAVTHPPCKSGVAETVMPVGKVSVKVLFK